MNKDELNNKNYLEIPVYNMVLVTVFYSVDDLPELLAGLTLRHSTMLCNVVCRETKNSSLFICVHVHVPVGTTICMPLNYRKAFVKL